MLSVIIHSPKPPSILTLLDLLPYNLLGVLELSAQIDDLAPSGGRIVGNPREVSAELSDLIVFQGRCVRGSLEVGAELGELGVPCAD
jgi:hypothetical protein